MVQQQGKLFNLGHKIRPLGPAMVALFLVVAPTIGGGRLCCHTPVWIYAKRIVTRVFVRLLAQVVVCGGGVTARQGLVGFTDASRQVKRGTTGDWKIDFQRPHVHAIFVGDGGIEAGVSGTVRQLRRGFVIKFTTRIVGVTQVDGWWLHTQSYRADGFHERQVARLLNDLDHHDVDKDGRHEGIVQGGQKGVENLDGFHRRVPKIFTGVGHGVLIVYEV